jgi:membrane protein YqaA with SNARE-associated domain
MYEWTLRFAEHKFAPRILALITFAESIFFPIPPDVLLAPMVLAKPHKAWSYEPWIQPAITALGKQDAFDAVVLWFQQWGVWVVFIAGFSPIPYKLFTVSAGFLHMAFLPFLIASAIGRGMRFFLVAGVIRWGGAAMEQKIRQWVDILGWLIVGLIIVAYFVLR